MCITYLITTERDECPQYWYRPSTQLHSFGELFAVHRSLHCFGLHTTMTNMYHQIQQIFQCTNIHTHK